MVNSHRILPNRGSYQNRWCRLPKMAILPKWYHLGRGPSIWDEFVRKPGKIVDNSTGDVAADSYHKYKEDIALLKKLGVPFWWRIPKIVSFWVSKYRFSLSWPRILPKGTIDLVNPKGVQYYHNVLDELAKNGIEPIVSSKICIPY